jgi:DnaK suppressor protein
VSDATDSAPTPPAPVPGAEREPLDLDRLLAVETELADVEHALGRLDAGTYGMCEVCSEPIDEQRLFHAPAARTCSSHP